MSEKKRQKQPAEDSVGAAIGLLGDRWTFLILREAFFGTQRFNEFAENLGLSRNILSSRLKTLVAEGIFEMCPYGPGQVRYEYRLAQPGRDIFPIVVALLQWGDKYLNSTGEPSIVLRHTRCGHDANPQLVCACCGEPIDVGEVLPTAGPGAPKWVRERLEALSAAFEAGLAADEGGAGVADQPAPALARDEA